jgi:hypothetical protein
MIKEKTDDIETDSVSCEGTQPKAILNAYCLERQKKALESQAKSRASGIDSKQVAQQAKFILKHYAESESKH